MKSRHLALSSMTLAVSLALAHMSAQAQTTAADAQKTEAQKAADAAKESAKTDALQLDRIVVTGTSSAAPKMKQSVSISTLSVEAIQEGGATNAAEVLRSIPGVRSESSGGESNANLTVRGLPISAGGSRYVQFQEDGLPVLQFGDIAFATPDTFVRVDNTLEQLQVIRGGSASTLATSAPGGIINFISNTGEEKGGSVAISRGLDYDQTRFDFGVGGPISDKTRFFIGGFYRTGEGARNGGVNVEQGGQLRGNITQQFDKGFVRLSFKLLDDHAPTLLPVPVRFSNGQISELPGIDPRRASFYSPYWITDQTLTATNGRVGSNINNGLTAKTTAIGAEGEFDLGSGVKLSNKFRNAKNSGRFIGVFPGDDPAPAAAGTTYLTGPNRGSAYRGNAFTAIVFNTSLDNMDLLANDLKVSKTFDLGGSSKLTPAGGFYLSNQHVGVTWNFNQYLLEATGDKPALLSSAANGTAGFGGCCMNTMDAQYRTSSPYASLAFETGPLNLDASVRKDTQKATGTFNQTFFIAANSGVRYDQASTNIINYKVDRTSYSLGGNYRITPDLGLFLRYSDGVSFNADRITFFNDAGLTNGKASQIPINKVKQTELGAKWRAGGFSSFVTLFQAKTDETNFDVTTQRGSANSYDAKGVEIELGYRIGGFKITGGMTYTNAEITASNNKALIGTTPNRQADWVYQVSPSYTMGDLSLGANIVGNTDSKDNSPAGPNTVTLPGFTIVNAFVSYRVLKDATISLNVNNLFDQIGYTESNDGRGAARSVNGRTTKVSLKYTF
jgi:outer membrane receptor protein involved in Fe transport